MLRVYDLKYIYMYMYYIIIMLLVSEWVVMSAYLK